MPTTDHQIGGRKVEKDRVQIQESEIAKAVRAEIEGLHAFFVGWFGGKLTNDDETFSNGFVRRFDPACILIPPGGTIVPLAQLTRMIRSGYGNNPDFRIEIRNVVLRREERMWVLATYEEWQVNALNSTPPNNARISTAWFRREKATTSGLAWMHIHECWMPREQVDAGPWDF